MDSQSSKVTVESIKTLEPELTSGVPDDTIQALIDEATMQAKIDGLPLIDRLDNTDVPIQNMGIKYLTLHMLANRANGSTAGAQTISAKVDQLEQKFADNTNVDWLNTSIWGKQYLNLVNTYQGTSFPMKLER